MMGQERNPGSGVASVKSDMGSGLYRFFSGCEAEDTDLRTSLPFDRLPLGEKRLRKAR